MGFDNNSNLNDSKEIAYDLRQRYAQQIGDIRERIIEARDNRNYSSWFNHLDSLYIEISHKLSNKEKETFNGMMKEINTSINKNRSAYENKGGNGSEIYMSLRKMNVWLQEMLEQHDIFGSKYIDDGL